jgi:hypothetical protein
MKYRRDQDIVLPSDTDLRALLKKAYALSGPQGLGFLHFRDAELDDETADAVLAAGESRLALSTDYVHGRALKFKVYRDEDGTLFVSAFWFDHDHRAYVDLLAEFGVTEATILAAEALAGKANA